LPKKTYKKSDLESVAKEFNEICDFEDPVETGPKVKVGDLEDDIKDIFDNVLEEEEFKMLSEESINICSLMGLESEFIEIKKDNEETNSDEKPNDKNDSNKKQDNKERENNIDKKSEPEMKVTKKRESKPKAEKKKAEKKKEEKTEKPKYKSKKGNIIQRTDFLRAINEVKPGLANKEIIEQSSHLIFADTEIWTYNDQISIKHNFETGLNGAVKADTFSKILEKIPEDEIEIVENKGKLKIKTKKIKGTIKIDPDVKLKPIKCPVNNSKKWETLPNNFCEGISFAAFSAGKNIERPELTCIWVTGDKLVTADSYRGTIFNLSSEMKQEFLLPATAAIQLARYNPDKVIAENGWIHFKNEFETTFSVRTYTDVTYPKQVWDFFDVEGEEITLPDGFVNVIDRAWTLITADFDLDKFVSLIVENSILTCRGEGSDGWIEENTEIEYSGEKLDIKVHPALLSEILKYNKNVIVGENRLLFKNERFQHTLCLSI
jgi:hypothetical protein